MYTLHTKRWCKLAAALGHRKSQIPLVLSAYSVTPLALNIVSIVNLTTWLRHRG